MITYLEHLLISYINVLPLELFVFTASIIEEIVAPIPSPTVMVIAGTFASVQGSTLGTLLLLSMLGALGKTIGATVVYKIADHAEDFAMARFGKYLNVSHEDVEKLGSRLGTGVREYFIMTFFRALPFVPSVLISAGSGILKVRMRVFLVATFFGSVIRDGIYLYAGYAGLELLRTFIARSSDIEDFIQITVLGLIVGTVCVLVYRKYK